MFFLLAALRFTDDRSNQSCEGWQCTPRRPGYWLNRTLILFQASRAAPRANAHEGKLILASGEEHRHKHKLHVALEALGTVLVWLSRC